MKLSQPYLLKRIIDYTTRIEGPNVRDIPYMPSATLIKDHQVKLRKGNWN